MAVRPACHVMWMWRATLTTLIRGCSLSCGLTSVLLTAEGGRGSLLASVLELLQPSIVDYLGRMVGASYFAHVLTQACPECSAFH